jgi:hypothetical protein
MYTEINHYFLLYIIFIVMLSYFCIATICIINRLSNLNYNDALTFIIKFFQGSRLFVFKTIEKKVTHRIKLKKKKIKLCLRFEECSTTRRGPFGPHR